METEVMSQKEQERITPEKIMKVGFGLGNFCITF